MRRVIRDSGSQGQGHWLMCDQREYEVPPRQKWHQIEHEMTKAAMHVLVSVKQPQSGAVWSKEVPKRSDQADMDQNFRGDIWLSLSDCNHHPVHHRISILVYDR